MPPRRAKNWPPAAVLSLVNQVNLTATISTEGTRAGYVGNNRRNAVLSQLASYTIHWGDGTSESGVGPPPLERSHTYPSGTGIVTINLTVVDVTTLTASAAISVTFTETTPPPTPTPPAAPTNLTATALSQTQVALSWQDNSSDEASFQIERSSSGGVFLPLTNVAAGVTSYIDSTGLPSTLYTYRVRAVNTAGTSAYSNTASAPTSDPPPVPTVPPTISLTPSSSSVILTNPVTLTITATPGSQPLESWQLDWMDGINVENGLGAPPSSRTLTYAAVGTYQPRLTVTPTGGTPVSTGTTISVIVVSPTGVATLAFTATGWATVSLWLPQGQLPSGSSLRIGSYTSQTNVKRTWPDGSARHALVTANILAATTHVVTVVTGSGSSTSTPGGNPTIRGPQLNPTFPTNAVIIAAGASIQAAINTNPAGTTFRLRAGTYSGTGNRNILPKSGQTFIGEFGAILDGTGWVTSDLDDAAFKALNADVDNVTIKNLEIRNMPQKGIMAYRDFSSGWMVDQCEIHHCKNGVEVPGNSTVQNCKIHHCVGTAGHPNPAERGGGYSFNTISGSNFINNEVNNNGTEQKWILCSNIICRGNYFHHNDFGGPWIDGGGTNSFIEDNICDDNIGPGIIMEIGCFTTIRRNACSRNGVSGIPGETHGGILFSISQGCEIYENTLTNNFFGIDMFIDCSRLSETYPPFPNPDLLNNSFHHNTIVADAGHEAVIFTYIGACQAPYVANTKNNRFDHNTYIVTDAVSWTWGNGNNLTFAGWQAVPQDPNPGTTFTPVWPTASAAFVIGGTTWTATMPAYTGNDPWLTGPLMIDSRATVIPMNGSTPHPLLRVKFDVRSFLGGGHVVDIAVDNILDVAAGNSVAYNVSLNVAGSGVYSKSGFTHSYLTRWRKRFTTGLTEAAWTPDFTSLLASKQFPAYSSQVGYPGSAGTPEVTNNFSDPIFDIGQFGGMLANMGEAGWRQEISTPYPDVDARYLIHKNVGSLGLIKKWADLSGSWSGHITTSSGAYIQSTSYWLDPRGVAPNGPAASNGTSIPGTTFFLENAHRPQIVAFAYMLTGDRYYADQLAFWAQATPLLVWPGDPAWYGSRATGGNNILLGDQIRGLGRGLLTVEDAAACLPTGHALIAYLTNMVARNIAFLDADCAFRSGGPFFAPSYWIIKNNPGAFNPNWQHTIPWTDSFVGLMVWKARRLGLTTTEGNTYLLRIGRMWSALFGTTGWPLEAAFAAPYAPLLIPAAPGPTDLTNPYATTARNYSTDIAAMVAAMGGPGQSPPAQYAGYYDVDARQGLMFGAAMGVDTTTKLNYLLAQPNVLADLANRSGHYVINISM